MWYKLYCCGVAVQAMPGDRELPEVYAQRFESVSIGERDGMNLPTAKPTAPLQAD
ncbi:MAG: hypothetical protein HRU04_18265 [Oceanospirillaceae bacterium]|nr:hypothetical protein [Oceanospirillaceae bacterium]